LIGFEFRGISRYKFNWDFCLIWICSWLKYPQHSGFRLPFNSTFRVSSSTERAVAATKSGAVGLAECASMMLFGLCIFRATWRQSLAAAAAGRTAENTSNRGLSTARPYESCKNIQGLAPPRCPFEACTTVVQIISTSLRQISAWLKWRSQLYWVINAVPHDLVRRIRFLRIKSLEQDLKYLYWTISKILLWNLITCKGT